MNTTTKFSRKREAILSSIRSTTTHPSAEWVYMQLKPTFPDLSLGTVYRNISAFCKSGTIISVGVVNGQERYDGNTLPHTHFVCDTCGCIIDLPGIEADMKLDNFVSQEYDLTVTSHDLTFHGKCSNCRQ